MPAQTTVIPSVDFALKAGGNFVGCATGGSLTLNQALDDAIYDQAAHWASKTEGMVSWQGQADGIMDATGGALITGHTAAAPLSVTFAGDAFKGLTEASISMSLATNDVVNTATGITRQVSPSTRSFEVSLSFDYYDPASTGNAALAACLDRLMGVATGAGAVVVTVGGLSFSFQGRPSTGSITKSAGDILRSGLTLVADGAVTDNSAGLGAGVTGLLASFFADGGATPLTVLAGTTTADNSEYTGSAYPGSISITAPFVGQVTTSVTLEGTGPLVRTATAA